MPSSTSNSDYPVNDPAPPERPVPTLRWGAAGLAAVLVLLAGLGSWEAHWRNWGAEPTYRNSEGFGEVLDGLVEFVRRQPMTAMLIAAGIGMCVGHLLAQSQAAQERP